MKKLKQAVMVCYQAIVKFIAFVLFTPKVSYLDKEAIRQSDEPMIFICNHCSFYDGAVVAANLHKKQKNDLSTVPRILVAKDWFDKKPLHYLLKWYGCMPINRFEMDTSWFTSSRRAIKEGKSMLIFPEGKTSQTEMNPFFPGFAILAEKTGAKVVPCAISSNYRWFRSHTKIIIGKPYVLTCPQGMRKSAFAGEQAVIAREKVSALYNGIKRTAESPAAAAQPETAEALHS